MKIYEVISIHPTTLQASMIEVLTTNSAIAARASSIKDRIATSIVMTENETIEILKQLPDNDVILRPLLQKAGENIFGW